MIVARVPRPIHAVRVLVAPGSALLVWDVAVTVVYRIGSTRFHGVEIPVSLFGTAIALYTGFLVNAAYSRWWEARTLWGQIVNASRSLGRQALVLIDESVPDARAGLRAQVVREQIAYVHVLRTALRKQELPVEARTYLTGAVLDDVGRATNRATAILTSLDHLLTEAVRRGMLGELSRLQLERTLVALTDAQGGLERIRNTPMPVQYRFLPRVFARLFCIVLPFAVVQDLGWFTPVGSGLVGLMFLLAVQVGDELGEPFVDGAHDVPMTALCRTIEIDLTQMIGDPSPAVLEPVDQILW